MLSKSLKIVTALSVAAIPLFNTPMVKASDLVVFPSTPTTAAHEIWANGELGQSFVATGVSVKGGFYVSYNAASAALGAPNSPTTSLTANLYSGEGLGLSNLLLSTPVIVDTTTDGYQDVNFDAAGIKLVAGSTYTISLTSPDRGWTVPSVCDANLDGAYLPGHPFFNGQIVLNESGICDNAFHMLDLVNPGVITPTPTPAPVVTGVKVEGKGIISAITSDTITISGKTILHLASNSIVKLNYNTALAVGKKVEYKGYKNTDGSLTIIKIEVK